MSNHPLYKHDYSPGNKYGRLTIVSREGRYAYCDCECGNQKKVDAYHLGQGTIKSCGCLRREKTAQRSYKHGDSKTRLYVTWCNMKQRAGKKKHYKHVIVCNDWLHFPTFKAWALSTGYRDDLEIDRKDNKLGYYPSNCRWVDSLSQVLNRRPQSNNTSGYVGVTRKRRKWEASFVRNKHRHYIGSFKTAFAAHRARLKFIREF